MSIEVSFFIMFITSVDFQRPLSIRMLNRKQEDVLTVHIVSSNMIYPLSWD